MAFKHLKLERRDRDYGVNFTDLDVRRFNLRVHDVSVVNDSVNLAIDHISLEERSGLVIDALSTRNFKISGSGMRFERLALRTPDSRVGMNHLYFRTGTWKGYNDFLEKVDISSEIVDSRVSFRTIAFFAPTLRNWQTVFEHVNGTVEGPVAAMSGNLTRVDCRDTRVSVRFGMYGVPDIPARALRSTWLRSKPTRRTWPLSSAILPGGRSSLPMQSGCAGWAASRLRDVSTACSAILRHRGGSAWIREMST